ncbi:Ig-like domain-containing protein [Grimontia hollisae]|uniref:Ig-like domain-containing protein n=1 Tax=Grimontia hollisae TaxID=673 RepID=UPI0013036DD3|nr:Ig-like domain-containing protein [Grimontia hollisae]
MQDIKINGTDSIQVSGFDIRVTDASGNVTVYEGGLQDLLRGKLTFTSDDGSKISNSAILSGINLDGMSGHIIPEVISNDKNEDNKKASQNNKEKTQEQLKEIQKQLAELKELKKKLEEEQKEKSESEEEQQPVNENVELLNQMIAQLSAQAPMQAMQQEQMSEEEVNDNTSTKRADSDAISMSSSSGSSNAPADAEVPADDEKDSEIFVEVKLSGRSDSGEKGDFITNAKKPTFELKTLPNATVSVEINGVTYEAKADSNGAAIISVAEDLPDGEYNMKVEAKDEAGNVATVNQQLVIDTVAPEITFDLATDSGVSDADGLTNVNKPTFTGSISGDPVSVYIQVGDVKYDLSAKNGQFSFTFPIEFPDGEYEFTLHAVDGAGNESIIPQKVIIDTVNDFKVSMSDLSDSGVKGDWITNSDKPVFRFDHEPNSTIQVIYNDQVIDVESQNSPTIFQFENALEEGEHTITFVSTDAAGNKSEITQTVVIDQTAPDFSIEGLTNEADTGNDGDNITADNTPTFHGKAEAGSTVYLEIDGDVYQAVVGENGRWSINVTNELKDGDYTVVSYAQDAAGNISKKVESKVTIDTIGPEIKGGFDESTDTGSSAKDGITNSEKLAFKGTTDAHAKVTLTIESLGITQEVTAKANGEWSFELTDVPEGSYSYVISAFDVAGNASIKNVEGTVVVDRSITDFSANMSAETDSGESQEDALTNSKTPTFTGTAEPGSKVQVTIRPEGNGKELPTYAPVTVGDDGKWSYTVPDALEDGKYTVSFNVTDLAGNEKTVELPIEIDTQISLTAQFDTHSDSGDKNDYITNIATPKIQGTADAGALIKLTLTHAETNKQIELETRANASGQWSITVPKEFALADQGEWSWTVNATDVAGNKAEPVEGKFTFDSEAPDVSVELVSETGFNPTHTNDKTLDLAITTEPGAKISVTVYKVEKGGVISSKPSYSTENPVVVGDNGQVSYAVKDLADGEYVYQVTVTDVAGNVTKTEQQPVTIDTKVPELGNITLTDSSDSNINNDGITNVKELSLKGVGSEVGSRIYITVENKKTGEKVALEPDFIEVNSANWVYKLPAELADGNYDISFVAVDSAGNQSPEKSIDVTIDTVAPEISGVVLKTESDTGFENNDFITKEQSPVFVGNADKGSDITIAIYRGETLVKTVTTKVTSEDGRWEVKVDGLNDGDYKWVVSAKDLAGNETVLNDANQTLKIDTAYVGASGKLHDETNSGSQADNITNERDAKLSGKGEPGSSVKLLNLTGPDGQTIDVSAVDAVSVSATGEWELKLPTLANGDGKYTWKVELTDVAGNVTTVSGNIVLDTETTVTASLESDYGHSAVDGITNDSTPTFAGTAEKGSTVELIILDSNNKKVEGIPTAVVGADGTWKITAPELTLQGEYTWYAKVTDVAGNTASTKESKFTLDTSAPIIVDAKLDPKSDAGFESDIPQTNVDTPTFTGQTSEGLASVVVKLYKVTNGVPNGVAAYTSEAEKADENGNFSVQITTQVAEGEYVWVVEATDVAGNKAVSQQQPLIIDKTEPSLSDVKLSEESDTSLEPGTNYSKDNTPTLTGKAEPGSRVSISLKKADGTEVDVKPDYVVVNPDGTWSFTPTSALEDGQYTWTAQAMDAAGNTKTSEKITLNIDTKAPTLSDVKLDSSTDSGSNTSDGITNDTTPSFSGTAEKGNKIELKLFDVNNPSVPAYVFETTVTDNNGAWTINTTALPEGSYTWTVVATDAAGNTTEHNSDKNLVIDTSIDEFTAGLDAKTDSGDHSDDDITNNKQITLSGKGEVGATVKLTSLVNKTTNEKVSLTGNVTVTVDKDGNWTLNAPALGEDGTYEWTVELVDIAGNKSELKGDFQLDTTITVDGRLDAASDSGESDSDNITNNTKPTLSGTGTDGDKIKVTLTGPGGYSHVMETTVENGTWQVTVEPALENDGKYSWVVESTDIAGNTAQDKGQFTLDTQAPSVKVSLENDSGLNSKDGITNKDLLQIKAIATGNAAKVELVVWKKGESKENEVFKQTHEFTGNDQEHTFNVSHLEDGAYEYQVIVTDVAGNVAESAVQQVTVDTVAPDLGEVTLENTQNENYVSDASLSFTGMAEAGSRIYLTLKDSTGKIIEVQPAYVQVGNNGSWTYNLSEETAELLKDGTYSWSFVAEDVAGNRSAEQKGEFKLDTKGPEVTFAGITKETDTGNDKDDMLTNNEKPVFTGTVSEASKVTVTLTPANGGKSYTFTTSEYVNGNWSITPNVDLADGQYTVTITATDMAGNVSNSVVSEKPLVIDTDVSGGEEFGLTQDTDSGIDGDNITNQQSLKLSGNVEPGTTVTLIGLKKPNGESITVEQVSVVANEDGSWELSIPNFGTDNGEYTYTLQYTDEAGNVKEVEGHFTFDNQIELSAKFASETGKDQDVIYTNNKQPVINGTGNAGDKITVVINGPAGTQTLTTEVGTDGRWSVTANELNQDGAYTWKVTATDAAGNSTVENGSFTLDTQAPTAEVSLENDTGFATNDGITNQKALQLKVDASGAAKVQLLVWKVGSENSPAVNETVNLNGQSSHTFTTKQLDDGNYQYKVIVTDIAGNTAESTVGAVTVDTAAPEIRDVVVNGVENQYFAKDAALSFSGSAEKGSRISLTLTKKNGEEVKVSPAYVEVNEQGKWTYKLDATTAAKLADGEYTWSFVATDAAGNQSQAITGPIVIDKTAPALTVEGITDASDSGVQNDKITNNTQPTFTGNVGEYAKIKIVITPVNGGASHTYETADFVNGKWELQVGTALAEGQYTIAITATDLAGNESPVKNSTLTIDKTVEGGDKGSFGLADESDSGTSQDDNVTNKTDLKLSGKVEAGTTVSLVSLTGPNGQPVSITDVSTETDEHGNWTLNLPKIDGDNGVYNYTLKYVDVAGNEKEVNGQFTFDNEIEVTGQFNSQTGTADNIVYTNDNTPAFSGTGTKGDVIRLTITDKKGYTKTIETTVNENGQWSITSEQLPADGEYTWSIVATDAAGNRQDNINGEFTLDTTAPEIKEIGLAENSDTGFSANDGITSDTTPSFVVKGEPGSKVVLKLWSGTTTTGAAKWTSEAVTIPEDGQVVIPHASTLTDGTYSWTVTLTDIAGNETVSEVQTLKVDTQAPTGGEFDLGANSDSGTSHVDNITNVKAPLFTGKGAEAGARVYITIKDAHGAPVNVEPEYVTVGTNGSWSYQLTNQLIDGKYTVQAHVVDAAGNVSSLTEQNLEIDTTPPTVTDVKLADGSDSGENKTDNITNVKKPVFTGTSEKGATISLVISKDGQVQHTLTTVVAEENGQWTISNVPELEDGKYTWSVTATDVAGNVSEAVAGEVKIDTTIDRFTVQLAEDDDTGHANNDGITNQKDIVLKGTAEAGAKVTLKSLKFGEEEINVTSVAAVSVVNGQWEIDLPLLDKGDGTYTYTVEIEDIAGNKHEITKTITLDTDKPGVNADLVTESDSGDVKNDGITNDKTPLFKGTVDEVSKVKLEIFKNGERVDVYGPIDANGEWSIQATNPLEDGVYTWKVTAEDVAGNTHVVEKTIVIDTTPPALTAGLDAASDTGESNSDGITKDNSLTIKGTVGGEGKHDVKVRLEFGPVNGQMQQQEVIAEKGKYSFNVDVTTDGTYSWKVIAVDVAGNESVKTGTVVVDTKLQEFSEGTGLESESDTGSSKEDKISNDRTPTFSGKTEPNAKVILKLQLKGSNEEPITVEAQANDDGNFIITVPDNKQLTVDGEYTWTMVARDLAGNEKTVTGEYTLDTTPPAITFDMNDDTGKDGDWITKDKTLSINGTTNDSNASIKVTIMSGGTVVDTQTVQATGGNWSYNYATELQDGTYTVKVESTDVAGNTYVSEKTLVVDTQIVNEFELTSDSGALDDDHLTNAEHLEFGGQTDKDATLELVVKSEDGQKVLHTYRPEVNPTTGQWSFELPDVLAEGKYVIVVTATDAAGNTNTSEDYKVEIDRTPPTLSDITMDSDDDTGVIGDWITETHQISISGQTAIGATVKILISGVNQTITAGVAADGKFTAELPRLEFGDYTLTIIATDAAGNATQHEQKLSVSPNVLPFVVGIENNSDSGVKGDNITNVTKPVISGAGTPGFKVEATINGHKYTATIDSKGQWKFQLNQALTDGTHTIHFVVKDVTGKEVEVKDYQFTVDTSVTTTIALDDTTDTGVKGDFITNAQNVYLTGVTEVGVTVVIKEKESGKVITEFVTTGESWGYMLTGLGEGKHNFVIELTDKAGNTSSKDASVTVDRSAPTLTVQVNGDDDNSVVTNQKTHTFSGTVEAGVHSLVLIVNGVKHQIEPKENGEWSIALDLQEGFNNYTVQATDVAGNVTTNQGTINIKTSIRFTMEVENDNGRFETDKILNGNKVVVGGTGSAGDVVTLVLTDSKGTETTHTFTVDETGRWSHEFTGLNDGTYKVHATIRDDAGNEAQREISNITIDNTNTDFSASLVDEDGATNDKVVADKQPTFSGRGEVGAEVVLVINNETYTTQVSSTGTWQFQLPIELTDGNYTAKIHSVDLAGNESPEQTIEFKVDSTAATVTHEIEGVYKNGDKQYVNSEQGKLVFKGTASEAGKIILQINNQEFTQVIDKGGDWSINVGDIIEREHSYTLIFEDVAGNRTTHKGEVIVDKTINTFVGLSWDSDTYGNDSQTFDGRTNDKSLRFEFNRNTSTTDKDVIATVKVTGPDGTSHTYTNIQTSKGHWDMPHQLTGGDGQYKFEWSFVDAAGNTKNSTMHVHLDTTIKELDITDIHADGEALVNGEAMFTNKGTLSMVFKPDNGHEYVKVAVVVNGVTIQATKTSEGFTFYGIPLNKGDNQLTFKAWDMAGNVTTITHTVVQKTEFEVVELSIEGHKQENVDNIGDIYSDDKDKTISLAGKVDVGSSFTIFVNGKPVETDKVGEDGSWKYDLKLEEGTNRIQINFVDAAGNEKVVSFNSIIDTVAPIITVDSIAENDGDQSNDNDKDSVVTKESITLSGRIDNGSTITQITVNDKVIDDLDQVLKFEGGKWTINIDGLNEGNNTIVISAVDKAGNTYDHNMTVVKDSAVTNLTAEVSEEKSAIVGTVEAGSKVVVEFTKANATEKSAETVQVEAVVDSKGNWTAELPKELTEGEWSWTVTATDAAGNTATEKSENNIVVGSNVGGGEIEGGDTGTGTETPEGEGNGAVILPSFPDQDMETLPELKNSDEEVNAFINDETAQTAKHIDNQGEKDSEDEGSLLFTQELIETKVFSGESMPDSSVTLEISGKVYETDADEDGDWLIKAEFSSQGSYDYQLTYTDLNGEVKVETGSVDIKQVNLDMNEAANQAESDATATESASSSNTATADYASSYSHDWSVPNHDYY